MKIGNVWKHYFGTTKHKFWVSWYLFRFSMSLFKRAFLHDLSKYLPSEALGFIKVIDNLENSTYGSDEYRESLRSIKPSIEKHYKRNSHHPEYYNGIGIYGIGIYGMSLKDVVEMWCDWQAAVRRHKDGKLENSLKANKERFSMDEQLFQILNNESNRR